MPLGTVFRLVYAYTVARSRNLKIEPTVAANWRPADDLYRQMSELADSRRQPSDYLAGLLARALARILAHYDGTEDAFVDDLLARWSEIDALKGGAKKRFQSLYTDKRFNDFPVYRDPPRPRPRPFEAAVETSRRLISVNAIRDCLRGLPTGAILGGSVSYGRFFNTKGVSDPSDLDLMIVMPTYAGHLEACTTALSEVPGISGDDLSQLSRRLPVALELAEAHPTMSVSQKVAFWSDTEDPILKPFGWPGAYEAQLHFFSRAAFEYVVLKDQGFIGGNKTAPPFVREALDYRNDQGRRREKGVLYSFSGTERMFSRELTEVDEGWLVNEVTCEVVDGRFYPGIFHNLILPSMEVRWDELEFSLTLAAKALVWKLYDRLVYERQLRVWENQNLANSHVRHSVFAPHEMTRVLNIQYWG